MLVIQQIIQNCIEIIVQYFLLNNKQSVSLKYKLNFLYIIHITWKIANIDIRKIPIIV